MAKSLTTAVVLASLILCSCSKRRDVQVSGVEQSAALQDLRLFSAYWLDPAQVPPPTIAFESRTATDGTVEVTVTPIRAEDAPWNQWEGEGARLFNNRAAHLFEVSIAGRDDVRWIPEASGLELNVEGSPTPPHRHPDNLLVPLLEYARQQERWLLSGDLMARTRAAGPFRAAYMPIGVHSQTVRGVVAFPIVDPQQLVVGLRVTLAAEDATGPHTVTFTYD
jgi:hypothetical protein